MDFAESLATPCCNWSQASPLLIIIACFAPLFALTIPLVKLDGWIGWIGKIILGIIATVFIIGANLFFISWAYNKIIIYQSDCPDEEKEPLGSVIVFACAALFIASVTITVIVLMITDFLEKLF
ncbi:MAG: hypothetical protein ACO20W_08860 [Anaerohalosphaeraceae bacterium]